MNPQLWWQVARAGGLVAYGLLAAATIWGLAVSTRLLGRWPAPGWTLDLHRYLGGLALTFTSIHLAALLLDTYIQFDLQDLLVPFAAAWRPAAVAWGVVALYLLVAVQATSLARRRLPHRLWRRIHLAAFPLFVAATAHLLTAGSDRANPAVLTMLTTIAAATIFLLAFRLLQLARSSQPTASRGRPPATMRAGHSPTSHSNPLPKAANQHHPDPLVRKASVELTGQSHPPTVRSAPSGPSPNPLQESLAAPPARPEHHQAGHQSPPAAPATPARPAPSPGSGC
jgi:hypothetical protein